MKPQTTFTFHLSDGQTETQIKVIADSIRDAERYFKKHFRAYRKHTIKMVLPDFCKLVAA